MQGYSIDRYSSNPKFDALGHPWGHASIGTPWLYPLILETPGLKKHEYRKFSIIEIKRRATVYR